MDYKITYELIAECEAKLLAAQKNRDIEVLNDLIHDELMFNDPDGKTITKSIDIEAYKAGDMLIKSIIPSEQKVNIIGDTAIVTVTVDLEASFISVPIKGKFRFLRVWKYSEGSIKIIAGSSIPVK